MNGCGRATLSFDTDFTERLLTDAGLGAGMRVLDIGCGHGDVSILAARLVGPRGQVLGIDREAHPLSAASERARKLGFPNLAFAQMDLHQAGAGGRRYDAIVGRRVLMYQPDPVAAVSGVAGALDPGGFVVLQEHDATISPAHVAPLPLHDRVHGWMWRTVQREGANIHMGFDLASVLARSGLVVEQVRAEAIVQTPTASHRTGAIVRAMLPRIVRHGVATAEEIEVDTLDVRLAEERRAADATYVGELVFGAWARKPDQVRSAP